MSRLFLDPRPMRPSRLRPPPSKSDAQRAMVLGHVLGRPEARSSLSGEGSPADVRAMAAGLEAIERAKQAEQAERGGRPVEVDCHDGGAPFRLLLTQAAVAPGATVLLTGSTRLGERPHGPLIDSLRESLGPAGLTIATGSPWPIEVRGASGRAPEPRFRIDASLSSQFASSLVLGAAALCRREGRAWQVELSGEPASAGYLAMTLRWARDAGFAVDDEPGRVVVRSWADRGPLPEVPGDWSSLGYLLLIAWKTGGLAEGVDLGAEHPDRAIVRVAAGAGLSLESPSPGLASLRGAASSGLIASGSECPDLLPTLASLACVLPAPSVLTEVSVLRHKESDRLGGIESLVRAAGGSTRLEGDSLHIEPPSRPASHLSLDAAGDHRRAMSAATLAVLTGATLDLGGHEHVEKSFPAFWAELERAGAIVSIR